MEKLVYIIDLDGTVWEDVPNELEDVIPEENIPWD